MPAKKTRVGKDTRAHRVDGALRRPHNRIGKMRESPPFPSYLFAPKEIWGNKNGIGESKEEYEENAGKLARQTQLLQKW